MPERKSNRARKSVDYTRYGGDEDIDDDDFADATPPVSKKAKLSNNENVNKNEKKSASRKEPKKRSAIDEKIFEQELQAALELSLSQSNASKETQGTAQTISLSTEAPPSTAETSEAPPNIVDIDDDRPPSPVVPRIEDPPVLHKVRLEDDDIEVLEENVVDQVPSSSRRRAAKPKKYIDSDSESGGADSDFDPDADEAESDAGSDEDFNADDDSDSDFGAPKKKASKKGSASTPKTVKQKQTTKTGKTSAAKPAGAAKVATTKSEVSKGIKPKPMKSVAPKTVTPKSVTPRTLISSSSSLASPVARAPAAGLTRKTPNWTPPGQASSTKSPLGGVSVKSPTTGLRIGLSRNMKLKPLHPKVKPVQ